MNSPFKVNPKKDKSVGVDTGDLYYHTAKIYQVVEDNDIKLKVVDDKTLIQDTIDVYKDKAGLKNIIKLYLKTGDVSLFNARPVLNNIDVTNIPACSPDDLLNQLPKDLVKGQSTEEFLKNITPELIVDYFKSLQKVDEVKEVKDNE